MNLIVFFGLLLLGGAYILKKTLYHLHMFQLNSYRVERYFRFLKKNKKKFLSPANLFFYGVIFVTGGLYTLILDFRVLIFPIIWGLFVLIRDIDLYRIGEKVKKPLVYTMRVKRILLVTGFLNIGLIFLLPRDATSLFGLTILMFIVPLNILVANFILKPVELYLKKHYYNDAKRILDSHKDLIKDRCYR